MIPETSGRRPEKIMKFSLTQNSSQLISDFRHLQIPKVWLTRVTAKILKILPSNCGDAKDKPPSWILRFLIKIAKLKKSCSKDYLSQILGPIFWNFWRSQILIRIFYQNFQCWSQNWLKWSSRDFKILLGNSNLKITTWCKF